MGISQLECLQLRRLVGPAGIGHVDYPANVVNVPTYLIPLPDGTLQGLVVSPFTVPSGTGIMKVRIQINDSGAQILYFKVVMNDVTIGLVIPSSGNGQNSAGGNYFYEGLMLYTNPTSTAKPIALLIGATAGSPPNLLLTNFVINAISFGPYVKQD